MNGFRIFVPLAWAAMALAQEPSELIGSIDFYGYGNANVAKLRDALPFHVGDHLPAQRDRETLQSLRKVTGREVKIELVCCLQNGRSLVYIGLAEDDAPPIRFNSRPNGDVKLSAEALKILSDRDEHSSAAVERGVAGEDDSKGYALDEDPASRADQLKLLAWTREHTDLVLRVLAESRANQQRAYAAEALGYAERSPRQIAALVEAAFDSDGLVRNNAVRALEVLCAVGAEVTRQIPAARFVPLLHSLTWTDRNKGSLVLAQLTKSRDPEILKMNWYVKGIDEKLP